MGALRSVAAAGAMALAAASGMDPAAAQLNLDVNSPPAVVLRHNMAQRHKYLLPYYASGAIGVARDGSVQVREPERIPPRGRLPLAHDLAKENEARAQLAQGVARAAGAPARADEVRALLAARFLAQAQPGWWVQDQQGRWVRK